MLLEEVYKKVIAFLNKGKFDYIVIGGLAAGVLGEPRLTGDVDIDLAMKKRDVAGFLRKAKKQGFNINERKCLANVSKTGTFRIFLSVFHIDFIIASTEFEKEAFRRKKSISFFRMKAYFPTPEDFIILKIIPGRPLDIADAEKVATRNSGRLDKKYLERWAQALSDQAQDARIYNEVKRLI